MTPQKGNDKMKVQGRMTGFVIGGGVVKGTSPDPSACWVAARAASQGLPTRPLRHIFIGKGEPEHEAGSKGVNYGVADPEAREVPPERRVSGAGRLDVRRVDGREDFLG